MIKKIKRLIAIYIDYIFIFIITYLPLSLISTIFEKFKIIILIFTIIFLIISFYLIIYKDLLFKNASLGKKIMGLGIYINNETPHKEILINRNKASFSSFPLYIFQILFRNKSYGDIKYNTEVKSLLKNN